MNKYLVLLDTDKIHRYIYSSGTLKSIRGASSILAELNEKETVKNRVASHNGEYIYAGGGQVMAEFNSDKEADEFIRAEQAEYEKCNALIPGIKEQYADDFKDVVEKSQIRLRRMKEERAYETPHLLSNSFFKTCQLCGINPASKPKYDKFICTSCKMKMERGEEIRKDPKKSPIYARFLDFIKKRPPYHEWKKAVFTKDLSELGELSNPKNYLGFIYADGNRMGERLFKRTSKTEYQELSSTIEEGLQESVFESLLEYIPEPYPRYLFTWDKVPGSDNEKLLNYLKENHNANWVESAEISKSSDGRTIRISKENNSAEIRINEKEENVILEIDSIRIYDLKVKLENGRLKIFERKIPFEFIIMGGDDLIIITPAEKAIPIALRTLEKFEERTEDIAKKIGEKKFTLSAGIVIAHSKYPISSFTQRGEELLKSAKKLNKKNWYGAESESERQDISTIDYLVVTTPSANPVDSIRKKDLVYTMGTKGEYTHKLTQRPFTLQKARKIIDTAKEIKKSGLSRSRLNLISDSLLKGKNQSILNILSLITSVMSSLNCRIESR
jgi:CRISPR-associated protein Cas10/Cmr2 subtype III-B